MTNFTTTTVFEGISPEGHDYRVTEMFNPDWQPASKPLYAVERNQGSHDPRFFSVYFGEDKAYAMSLAYAQ